MKKYLLLSLTVILGYGAKAQYFYQYFDGADTSAYNSVIVVTDTAAGNIWQVGMPQKIIFNSASTAPNALVTDTLNYYPVNNLSRATFWYVPQFWQPFGIMAVQWMQKLDMERGKDGGYVEFSSDKGTTWSNAFDNPYVYNYYGFNNNNKDTLANGDVVFTGRDSLWKNIWLCFDNSYFIQYDTIFLRFVFESDSLPELREGWMIDNLFISPTIIHTIKEPTDVYMKVFPSPTTGLVHIVAEKRNDFHIIEKIELIAADGRTVQTWGQAPTKFFVDISAHAPGQYYLRVTTNIQTQTFPVLLNKN